LDICIYYLRKVYFFCYFCTNEFEDENYLNQTCRKHLIGNEKIFLKCDSSRWFSNLDKKIQLYIDLVRNEDALTAESCINSQIEEFYKKEIYKEEDSRFGCGLCSKMFRGSSFVQNHIQNKHESNLAKVKEKGIAVQYQKNYENDPFHISPTDVYSSPSEEEVSQIYNNYHKIQKDKKDKEEQEREERRKEHYSRKNQSSYRNRDNFRPEKRHDYEEVRKDRKLVDYADIAIDWDKPKERSIDIDYEKSLHEFIPKS